MTVADAPVDAPDEVLRALAEAYGVTLEYRDWLGRLVEVPVTTVRAVLGALGVAASTREEAAAALTGEALAAWRRTLPATVVVRQ